MLHTYEVEIKSLLGQEKVAVDNLKKKLFELYSDVKLIKKGKQLNHYFHAPTNMEIMAKNISGFLTEDKKILFKDIIQKGKKISIRTRDADGTVILVLKASVGDDTSSNGVKRIEFEAIVNKTLAELDQLLIDSGATYQAKWSREREEYVSGPIHICIDKNAGYGYLAEFEIVTEDEGKLDTIKTELISIMDKLGVTELPQDRLERMFAHYNTHWPEYYGTDKTFIIN